MHKTVQLKYLSLAVACLVLYGTQDINDFEIELGLQLQICNEIAWNLAIGS